MGESLLSPEEIAALVSKMNQETDESIDSPGDLSGGKEDIAVKGYFSEGYNESEQGKNVIADDRPMTNGQLPKTETRKVIFSPFDDKEVIGGVRSRGNIEKFDHMHFPLKIVLGEIKMTIRELLDLEKDSVITLNTLTGEDASLLINDKLLAKGEIVVLNDCFALRISATDASVGERNAKG